MSEESLMNSGSETATETTDATTQTTETTTETKDTFFGDNSKSTEGQNVFEMIGLGDGLHENGKLFGKFDKPADLAKSYRELEKKMTLDAKNVKAPEKYEFNYDGDTFKKAGVNSEDALLQKVLPVFKDANLPQETVDKILETVLQHNTEGMVSYEDEVAKLGGDKDAIISDLVAFSSKNLSKDEVNVFNNIAITADGTKLLHKLVGMTREMNIPAQASAVDSKTATQLEADAIDFRNSPSTDMSLPHNQEKYAEMMSFYHNALTS